MMTPSILLSLVIAGCGGPHAKSEPRDSTGQTARSQARPAPQSVSFDGARAFTLLQQQCDFGPRPMGTSAHQQCLHWIENKLAPYTDGKPIEQTFDYTSPVNGVQFPVTNVIGRFNPRAKTQVMICGHWDTRPVADQDPNPANQTQPILGADDGASETAVMLEMARVLHSQRPAVGVELVFFDGEDYARAPNAEDEMYLGSKYFALHPQDPTTHASLKPAYGILLDMIADRNLDIYEEQNSVAREPQIVDKVWSAAAAIGDGAHFIPRMKYTVEDDHLPLIDHGIPCIDCIDFDYETFQDPAHQYWHTLQDTPDKCSPDSLKIVGDVMLEVIRREGKTP